MQAGKLYPFVLEMYENGGGQEMRLNWSYAGQSTTLVPASSFFQQDGAGSEGLSIEGAGGNDVIFGSDDADTISGGNDADRLYGEAGADTLIGGDGVDRLQGDAGDDALYGGHDADTLYLSLIHI